MPLGNKHLKESTGSDTMTFRIDHRLTSALRSESKGKGESFNVLMSQILKNYVDFHKPAAQAESIYFPMQLISKLFDNLSDEEIDKFALEYVEHDLEEEMNIFRQDYALSIFMTTLLYWLKISGFSFSQNRVANDDETFTIRFNMGREFSDFFGKSIGHICKHFNITNPKIEVTNNAVMFTIPQ